MAEILSSAILTSTTQEVVSQFKCVVLQTHIFCRLEATFSMLFDLKAINFCNALSEIFHENLFLIERPHS